MKHTIFVSDIHLTDQQPQLTNLFFNFITSPEVSSADALFILGDLFAVWAGDDDYSEFNKRIKTAIRKISEKIPVYLMPGNRDFILGKKFAEESQCSLLSDPHKIRLYGTGTLLTHGDILCTKDRKQIIFRRLTQNKVSRKLFLALPLKLRKKLALLVRKAVAKSKKSKTDTIMDVNVEAVNRMLDRYGCSQIIHGHTHKSQICNFVLGDKSARRIVLGDWDISNSNALLYREDSTIEFF